MFVIALVGGLPAVAVLLAILWFGDYEPKVRWTALVLIGLWWLVFAGVARERFIRPLQTIANMIAAMREGDFSIRARGATVNDDLGLALLELNTLGETLREQRLGALEATTLLRRVMAEIDVAVFAFDEDDRLQLVNRGAERLMDAPAERLMGRTAIGMGLAECLHGDTAGVRDMVFAGGAGRFGYRRSAFRQGGRPHALVVLADLSRALREEERLAWQRLIRVLGHEINNSLAPIKSVAQSLRDQLGRNGLAGGAATADVERGLDLIAGRAEALSRFMQAYARLARLPQPKRTPLDVGTWVRRVCALETRRAVRVVEGPPLTVNADGDQLDQVLINLVANAVDAVEQTGEGGAGGVEVTWAAGDGWLTVRVRDDGPGISGTANLFVPFFTTKPRGTGIGLALSRQIAEAHGGAIALANRDDRRGCLAELRLPVG